MALPTPEEIQYQEDHIHDDRSGDIVTSHAICITIAVIAVLFRFISRRMCKASIQADDWMIIVALLLAAGEVGGGLVCMHNLPECVSFNGGKHSILLTNPKGFAKSVLATEYFYTSAIAAVKISILLLYRRLFPDRGFRIILWGFGAFILTYSTVQLLVTLFQCQPIRGAWDPFIKAKCIKLNLEFMIMGSLNVVTDVTTWCLPMPLLWSLKISIERRLQVMSMFLLGGFVCVISIYRVPKIGTLSLSDAPWSDVDACVWGVVEVCVGIVSACTPTLRPLFNWVFHGLRANSKDSEGPEPDLLVSPPPADRAMKPWTISTQVEMEHATDSERSLSQTSA
ncbi:hypothetical protein MMC22_011977 [Lobaria immixta]|nr:hypothetical protein [Lobaria immixta]